MIRVMLIEAKIMLALNHNTTGSLVLFILPPEDM
jgi:hypothetical protein